MCHHCEINRRRDDSEVVCVSCGKLYTRLALDHTGRCKKCRPKIACVKCNREYDPIELNSNGWCNSCVAASRIVHCVECSEPFDKDQLNEDGYCPRCGSTKDFIDYVEGSTSCFGCGLDFIQKNSESAFCKSCEEILAEKRCLTCLRQEHEYQFLGEDGRCNICQWDNVQIKICEKCNTTPAYGGFTLCETCRNEQK